MQYVCRQFSFSLNNLRKFCYTKASASHYYTLVCFTLSLKQKKRQIENLSQKRKKKAQRIEKIPLKIIRFLFVLFSPKYKFFFLYTFTKL